MYYQCCVCKTLRKDAIRLYHFPNSKQRLLKWFMCLKNQRIGDYSAPEQLSKALICEKHFEERFISHPTRRLKAIAYPSLFTQDEISSGIPSQENTENMDPLKEHGYARTQHADHTYCQQLLQRAHMGSHASKLNLGDNTTHDIPVQPEGYLKQPTNTVQIMACSSTEEQLQAQDTGIVQNINKSAKRPKQQRRRLIGRLMNLTPTGRIIYDEYKKSKRQADFHQRAKRALKFSKDASFETLTKEMNPYAKTIFKMQINLCKKHRKGCRFSLEEKLVALSIMKQSPKCYRFLHKIFILPTRSTLNKMISKLKIESGICPKVFGVMGKEAENWNDKKKLCSIMFDEMSLDTGLTYDKNKDKINGLVELDQRKNEYADHALVFMLRGAVHKWQQPIAFYFCQGATKSTELKKFYLI